MGGAHFSRRSTTISSHHNSAMISRNERKNYDNIIMFSEKATNKIITFSVREKKRKIVSSYFQ